MKNKFEKGDVAIIRRDPLKGFADHHNVTYGGKFCTIIGIVQGRQMWMYRVSVKTKYIDIQFFVSEYDLKPAAMYPNLF